MPYRYLEDIAIADVAFEAEGRTLQELLKAAAEAVTNMMVRDVATIDQNVVKCFDIEAPSAEMLLYRFLQELIFYKDSERLLFNRFELSIDREIPLWHMRVQAFGEEIDPEKQELVGDAKAVSFHNLRVLQTPAKWIADVIIDV